MMPAILLILVIVTTAANPKPHLSYKAHFPYPVHGTCEAALSRLDKDSFVFDLSEGEKVVDVSAACELAGTYEA